jgi:protein ImuB
MHWIALQPASDARTVASQEEGAATGGPRSSAWAWWALQFTPLVARVEAALVMEVSASERLFGGRQRLAGPIV